MAMPEPKRRFGLLKFVIRRLAVVVLALCALVLAVVAMAIGCLYTPGCGATG
jgi:hypothetical protein